MQPPTLSTNRGNIMNTISKLGTCERGTSIATIIMISIMIVFAIIATAQFLEIGQTTITHIDSAVDDGSLFST